MYYLIKKTDSSSMFPYMCCEGMKWTHWHTTMLKAVQSPAKFALTNFGSVEELIRAKEFSVIYKAETPINLQDHPELFI